MWFHFVVWICRHAIESLLIPKLVITNSSLVTSVSRRVLPCLCSNGIVCAEISLGPVVDVGEHIQSHTIVLDGLSDIVWICVLRMCAHNEN